MGMWAGYQGVALLSKTKEEGFNEEARVEGCAVAMRSLERCSCKPRNGGNHQERERQDGILSSCLQREVALLLTSSNLL